MSAEKSLPATAKLEEVLDYWRQHAKTVREKLYDGRTASIIEDLIGDVEKAARARLTWLNDTDAAVYSGLTTTALHRRFPRMVESADARWSLAGRRERQYRESALPRTKERLARLASAEEAARGKD